MSKRHKQHSTRHRTNQLRIIGGTWRGRKLSFPSSEGLRPTPDRVRETAFNWLAPVLPGARCLDIFAGSGALGLEALSRGAAHVDLVDSSSSVASQLRDNLSLLNSSVGRVHHANALQWLQAYSCRQNPPYDIIFLDPPFRQELARDCIRQVDQLSILSPRSWVYLEMAIDEPLPPIPDHWHLHREKVAGQVCYRLFSVTSPQLNQP